MIQSYSWSAWWGSRNYRDTFELWQTERFGGRVALFGRKIYFAEDPAEIVRFMRAIVQGDIGTVDAVKLCHDIASKLPRRDH